MGKEITYQDGIQLGRRVQHHAHTASGPGGLPSQLDTRPAQGCRIYLLQNRKYLNFCSCFVKTLTIMPRIFQVDADVCMSIYLGFVCLSQALAHIALQWTDGRRRRKYGVSSSPQELWWTETRHSQMTWDSCVSYYAWLPPYDFAIKGLPSLKWKQPL